VRKSNTEFRKSSSISVRKAGNKRTATGYAIVFAPAISNDLGNFVESIDSHAVDLSRNAVWCLRAHDETRQIASTLSGSLRLTKDSRGVRFEVDLPDTQDGNDLAVLIANGDGGQCSFGFIAESDLWSYRGDMPHRLVTKLQLIEISIGVIQPAYSLTSLALASGARSNALRLDTRKLLHLLSLRNDPTDSIVGPGRIITSQTPDGKTTVAFGADFCQCDTQNPDRQLTCGTCQASVLYLSKYDEFSCACGENDAPNHVCAQCGLAFDRSKVKEKPTLLEQVQETQEITCKCTSHRCETCGATFSDADQQQDYLGSSQDDARSLHLGLLQRRMAE